MKIRSILCLLVCLVLIIPVNAQETLDVGNLAVTNGCSTIDGQKPMLTRVEDAENAKAAFLYEVTTDTVMYAFNADTPMYPTSLTKIMSALVIIEQCNLSDIVTVRQDVLDTLPKDAANTALKDGEVMSVENLLYSMLVDSANDSTVVLADFACGSLDACVEIMNQKAQEFGCTGTTFKNVHGLYEEGHLSTARDIARIIREAIKNETFVKFFGTKYYTIPATNKTGERGLITGNFLMTRGEMQIYYDSRVTGGRTGVDYNGLRSIAATSTDGELEMISVIIGSKSIVLEDGITVTTFGGFPETSALLNAGMKGMSAVQILAENQTLRQYSVENGANSVVVGPQVSVSAILPDTVTSGDLIYRYNDLYAGLAAPVEKGMKVSTLEVLYNGICVAQADLYTMNAVDVKEQTQQIRGSASGTAFSNIFMVIVGVIVFAAILLYVSRVIRRARLQARRKRIQEQNRRRR